MTRPAYSPVPFADPKNHVPQKPVYLFERLLYFLFKVEEFRYVILFCHEGREARVAI